MSRGIANKRLLRELELLSCGSAAPGIIAWAREEGSRLDVLDAEICGAAGTPYENGIFRLEVNIPPEYPLKPPRVKFLTKIYHPNIDSEGRICLDSLSMPPKGAWKPSLNICTLLTSIQALMSAPNADDGLMADITEEFRRSPSVFRRKASEYTRRFANEIRSTQGVGPASAPTSERKNDNSNPCTIEPKEVESADAASHQRLASRSIEDAWDQRQEGRLKKVRRK